MLQVGFSKFDITPEESVPLAGYGNSHRRMSERVADPLYGTCIAFTDEQGRSFLTFSMDLTSPYTSVISDVRLALAAELDIPVHNIPVSTTHNHSAPDFKRLDMPVILRYNELLSARMKQGARDALADRKPAQIFCARVETKGHNFVRDYVLEDGSLAGPNYGSFTQSPIAGHQADSDGQMQLVKIVREGGKDIVIVNFQGHPHREGAYRHYHITSDVAGAVKTELEQLLDCHAAYYTGASGNLNCESRILEENATDNYKDQGKVLAALAAEAQFTPVESGPILGKKLTVDLEVNHTQDHLVEAAQMVEKVWADTGNGKTTREAGKPYGIHSPYHASAIIAKSKMGKTEGIQIAVSRIGGLGFAAVPYEMYDTEGRFIKENAPYAMTIVATCTNANRCYMPNQLAFRNGGYSVDICRFLPGSGEKMAEIFVEQLTELKNAE